MARIKKKIAPKKAVIFLHTDTVIKKWLVGLCAKQKARVSYSQMANRIFQAARKNPKFIRAA